MSASTDSVQAMAAEILEASAPAYANAATAVLQRRIAADGSASSAAWKRNLIQRVLELAAAVRSAEPALFARRVDWLRRAYQARGADESELVAMLESLQQALGDELPAPLRDTVAEPLQLALSSIAQPLAPASAVIDAESAPGRLALQYLQACLEGRSDEAIALVLDSIDDDMTPQRVYLDVLVPAQRETGQLWHVGEISIAEERVVSETTRQLLTLISHEHAPGIASDRVVLGASVAGNAHDIGLRVITDLFRLAGWRALFLGADVPPTEIARAALLFGADLVVLNATLEVQLKELGRTIAEIREAAPRTRILVGGLVFAESPELWRQLGADGYAADAANAVDVGASLLD
jgi:methanogenic corrinoid protein MtbC1